MLKTATAAATELSRHQALSEAVSSFRSHLAQDEIRLGAAAALAGSRVLDYASTHPARDGSSNELSVASGSRVMSSEPEETSSAGQGSAAQYDPFRTKQRRRTTTEQLKVLESHFNRNHKPDINLRKALAERLDMTPREIQVWFQNRRAKIKKLREKAERAGAEISDINQASSQPSSSQPSDTPATYPALPFLPRLPVSTQPSSGVSQRYASDAAYFNRHMQSGAPPSHDAASTWFQSPVSRFTSTYNLPTDQTSFSLPQQPGVGSASAATTASMYPSPVSASASGLSTPSPSELNVSAEQTSTGISAGFATGSPTAGFRHIDSYMSVPYSGLSNSQRGAPYAYNQSEPAITRLVYQSGNFVHLGRDEMSSNGSSSDTESVLPTPYAENVHGRYSTTQGSNQPAFNQYTFGASMPAWQYGIPTPSDVHGESNLMTTAERRASCPAFVPPEFGVMPPSSLTAAYTYDAATGAASSSFGAPTFLLHRRHSLAPVSPALGEEVPPPLPPHPSGFASAFDSTGVTSEAPMLSASVVTNQPIDGHAVQR
ncbi:hypothetical protein ACM66B_000226 [Microbotryomycetes sp. NB124-2]